MTNDERRLLELCDTTEEAWTTLERYREKLVEHDAQRHFGLTVKRTPGREKPWGVFIKRRQ